jgi:hypothetical protein
MDRRRHRIRFILLAAITALACAACSGGPRPGNTRSTPKPGALDVLSSASLSAPGAALLDAAGLDGAPRYDLRATVEPETGEVDATMIAELPLGDPGAPLQFRVFPNLAAFDAGFTMDDVVVGGEAGRAHLDRSLLTLEPPPDAAGPTVVVELPFSYTVPASDLSTDLLSSFAGSALDPAETGLLGRHQGGISLGHWFPIWMEPGMAAEPEPDGFGDIANFPAARFSATIDVPAGWQVFTGGTTVERREDGGRVISREEGLGLRDLSVYAGRDVEATEVEVDGVTVRNVSDPATARCYPR